MLEEKLRHFVNGFKPTVKHAIGMEEPRNFSSALDKACLKGDIGREIVEATGFTAKRSVDAVKK